MVPEASVDKNLPVYAMRGLGWQKPDLVGVGSAVAANSDGDSNSARDSEEYGVQCGLKANVSTGLFGCDVLEALPYDSKAAVVQKTGSSVAAAFVAGAAVIIRQYFFGSSLSFSSLPATLATGASFSVAYQPAL